MRNLTRQLTYRLDAPEGPGPAEFKRYLTPQACLPSPDYAHHLRVIGAVFARWARAKELDELWICPGCGWADDHAEGCPRAEDRCYVLGVDIETA